MEKWIDWASRLQAIAQNGLTYAKDPYDIERYTQLRAIAVDIAAHHTGLEHSHLIKPFASDDGYATPKIDLRGVVFRDDAILLVKERSDGLWTLPGGWADVGESPSEGVVKEIREESGFETRPIKLLAVYDRNKHDYPPLLHHIYKIFIQCEIIGGAPTESIETDGVGFFCEDKIPKLSLTRVTYAQIARMFDHLRNPEIPADFD